MTKQAPKSILTDEKESYPTHFSDEILEKLSEMIAEKVIEKLRKNEDDKRRMLIKQKIASESR